MNKTSASQCADIQKVPGPARPQHRLTLTLAPMSNHSMCLKDLNRIPPLPMCRRRVKMQDRKIGKMCVGVLGARLEKRKTHPRKRRGTPLHPVMYNYATNASIKLLPRAAHVVTLNTTHVLVTVEGRAVLRRREAPAGYGGEPRMISRTREVRGEGWSSIISDYVRTTGKLVH